MAYAPFDNEALSWFARRANPSLTLDQAWRPVDWLSGRDGLEGLFGLDRPSHFLRHHRGLMPRLWEPQITRAMRAMLLEDPRRTLVRCQALLVALEGAETTRLDAVDAITADASDRMDLAIHARTEDGTPCVVVLEAKLESELSDTQLPKYLHGLRSRYPQRSQRHLWVVATLKSETTTQALTRKENEEWGFMTWRRLLINWQRSLPEDPGQDVLSLFSEI